MRRYQDEPSAIAEAAWKRGYLTPLELLRVGAWKEARIPAAISVNPNGRIEEVTGNTIRTLDEAGAREWKPLGEASDLFWDEYAAILRQVVGSSYDHSGLYGLDGVRYPVASAILYILVPSVFPVIDRHAVRAIFGSPSEGAAVPSTQTWWYRHVVYVAYARHLATIVHARLPRLSFHGLDVRAQDAGRAVLAGGDYAREVRAEWPPIDIPAQLRVQRRVPATRQVAS